jgi:5-oxoprolinase (ATP-hydrolysing) subunit A
MRIDLNSDLGEGYGPWAMGDDVAMLDIVTSANVACGGHASDPETMYRTLVAARDRGVVVGAHPGYADPLGFGRRVIPMTPAEIGRMVAAQVGALRGVAALAGARVAYVKPHGALGNLAAADAEVAAEIARVAGVLGLPVLAISGTALEMACRGAEVEVFSEVFADRAYQADGQLVPRARAGAVIHDAGAAAARLMAFLRSGEMPCLDGGSVRLAAQSVCVHSDTPGAVAMAHDIRARLAAEGVELGAFLG